jgi:DNA-directed RNA polymerase specialized sigma24 family protein
MTGRPVRRRPPRRRGCGGERVRLVGLAYWMLRSVADAEEVLQEAFLRLLATGATGAAGGVADPGAWLATVVSRLCLDRLGPADPGEECAGADLAGLVAVLDPEVTLRSSPRPRPGAWLADKRELGLC